MLILNFEKVLVEKLVWTICHIQLTVCITSSGLSRQRNIQLQNFGDPAGPAQAAQYCSSVPAADVRSTAAAPHAADSSPPAATLELGCSATAGRVLQTTIKLAGSPAATAQLISRAQGAGSSPASITQQTVLLGNSSTPTLTASQAQMYLRAQMAQQNNLVQVARSLGRAVPLSPQLILTPTAAVATIQPDTSSQSVSQQTANAQMQNLILHGQQGAVVSSPSQAQLQGLSMKQCAGGAAELALHGQTGLQLKSPEPDSGSQVPPAPLGPPGTAVKASPADASSEPSKMNDISSGLCPHVSHNVTTSTHPLINTAYAQIQTHQLLQHKQQFLIQQQSQLSQKSPGQFFQPGAVQPSIQDQAQTVQAVALQPALASQHCAIPALPKPPAPCQQAAIFHSSVNPQVLTHIGQSSLLSPTKDKQLQISATGLPLQPSPAQIAVVMQDDADKDNFAPPAARNPPSEQQLLSLPTQEPANIEQCLSDHNHLTRSSEGTGAAECVNAKPGVCIPPAMTSGNGNNAPTVTGSTPQNGESKTPQAIVKPQILTHVIEGFVIQEGAEPFPVERPSLLIENLKKQKQQQQSYSELEKKAQDSHTVDSEMEDISHQDMKNQQEEPTLSCELCGKVDFAYNFKRSKRFCSTVCAKRYNVGCTKRIGLFPRRPTPENPKKQKASSNSHQNTSSEAKKRNPSSQTVPAGSFSSPRLCNLSHGESTQCSDMSSYEEPPSPLSVASSGAQRPRRDRGPEHGENQGREMPFLPSDPAKWKVADVYEFICSLPGCQEIAEEFRAQEIDGQALLLLKEDHLMSAMNIKLGPALKIFARISMLKDS
ncbi:polyhomeotic-like protein 2 isoform X1 [Electrophorus electricus]|nr:polyhomeotic-like protein 2 isoform X1 [Electrophorus electricus]